MLAEGQLRVAVAQFTAAIGDARANLADMRALLAEAAGSRADLICFPELCLPGYLLDPAGYDAAFLAELSRADETLQSDAGQLGVRIVYGTARRAARLLYNLVVVTERDGSRTEYAKTHMVEAERSVFAAGHELVLAADGDLGLGCCYDLAFPRFCAGLADAGASVLVFPMAWERERAFVFEGIVAARAIENVAYVVCANQSGASGTLRFHGRSKIVDPMGNTIMEMGEMDGLGAADLDLAWLSRLRSSLESSTYPLLADRLPDMPARRGAARIRRALTEAVDKPSAGTLIP
jgi:predicted amidohydrolase